MPPEPTDAVGLLLGPRDLRDTADLESDVSARRRGSALPGTIAAGGGPGSEAVLRVVEPSSPPGLVETIVGDVTGFYLGG